MATLTHSFGTKLQYDADGIGSYTDVVDVKDVDPGVSESGKSDATHLTITDAHKDHFQGLIDAGDFNSNIYFSKAQHNTLLGIHNGRVFYFWKYVLPLLAGESNNSTFAWTGYLLALGRPVAAEDELLMAPARISIKGKPTFTQGS
jgi:hypothetical protein